MAEAMACLLCAVLGVSMGRSLHVSYSINGLS